MAEKRNAKSRNIRILAFRFFCIASETTHFRPARARLTNASTVFAATGTIS